MKDSLTNEDTGTWTVTTRSGARYTFNLDDRTVLREVGADDNRFGPEYEVPLPIVGPIDAAMGDPVYVVVDVDGLVGWMRSTPIVSIEAVA